MPLNKETKPTDTAHLYIYIYSSRLVINHSQKIFLGDFFLIDYMQFNSGVS